jgi:hypothetical protein
MAPCRSNEFRRRVALFRFAAKTVQYGQGFHQVTLPGWADELTPAQRAVLEAACFYDKAIVEADGSVSRPREEYDEPPWRAGGEHITADPDRITQIARAALVLTQFEHKYIC